MAEYSKITSNQESQLLNKANQFLPDGTNGNIKVGNHQSFLVQKGLGSKIWDVSGNEYIDWLMGSGPMILGHAFPSVIEAVIKAVKDGSTYFATHEKAVELAEMLCEAIPCAEQVRFTVSGTDATFQAMRVCRAFTKKEKILKFEGGYHGSSDYAMMSVTPDASVEYPQTQANSSGIPKAISDLVLAAPFNDLQTTSQIIEAHKDDIAAVIVEPLQRVIAPEPGFLQGLRDITKKYSIPLIFDEVVTGFRLSYGGAQQHYGVTPDLACVGKIMGGGYPLAAVTGITDIMSSYESSTDSEYFVPQTGTLNGNPIACAAGIATLKELQNKDNYEKINNTGKQIREFIREASSRHNIPVQICGENQIFGLFFTDRKISNYRDGLATDSALHARFNSGLLDRGILKAWPQKFYPSAAHSQEDIEVTQQAIEQTFSQLAQSI